MYNNSIIYSVYTYGHGLLEEDLLGVRDTVDDHLWFPVANQRTMLFRIAYSNKIFCWLHQWCSAPFQCSKAIAHPRVATLSLSTYTVANFR